MDQKELLKRIQDCFEAYESGIPMVDDRTYDEYVTAYLAKGGSYHQIYGESLVQSEYPCLSQNNIYDEDELLKEYFAKRLNLSEVKSSWAREYSDGVKTSVIVCSPKFDGVSVYFLIDPETKIPFSVFSRKNKRLYPFIEKRLIELFTDKYLSRVSEDWYESYNDDLTVRVEVIMPREVFDEKYRRTADRPDGKANPRNMVSGLLSKKYPELALEDVDFVPFDKTSPKDYEDYFPEKSYPVLRIDKSLIMKYLESLEDLSNLPQKGKFSLFLENYFKEVFAKYYCDGLVFRPNDLDYRVSMGSDGHHWASETAYKNFNEEKHETVLEGVEFTLSPSGEFFPIGKLKSVQFKDAEVSNVSLNSMRFLQEEFEFPIKIGSTLTIIKSGDIIPKVIDVEEPTAECVDIVLDQCPFCVQDTVRDGAYLFCKNVDCDERLVKLLIKQVQFSQEFLGLKGISERTVRKLYNLGVSNFYDLLTTELKSGSSEEDSLGPSMTVKLNTLVSEIKSKEWTLGVAFRLMQVEDFGRSTSGKFDKWVPRNTQESLFDNGVMVTEELPNTISTFFGSQSGINSKVEGRLMEYLDTVGMSILSILTINPVVLDEKAEALPKFIVTGSLNGMTKKEFSSSLSGKAVEVTSMSQADYLVCNSFNPDKPSGKAKKALSMRDKGIDIKIVTQPEFIESLTDSSVA